MFKCLQIICAKYYELRYMFLKTVSRQSWRVCLTQSLFSVSSLKDKQLIKKQTYMKAESCKLYSGVLWIFKPNVIKIDPYNFELYCFKVCAFFETQCSQAYFWPTLYILMFRIIIRDKMNVRYKLAVVTIAVVVVAKHTHNISSKQLNKL